jgi:sulfite reductase alpha subunit-like flavoprotein
MIRPRYYTIASSSLYSPRRLVIAVSVESFATPGGEREGLVSRYLTQIMKANGTNKTCKIFVKESNFVMPAEAATPMIMVGPGTGVVPFIGFCEERKVLRESGKTLGEGHLFFGCRDKDTDFIYRDFMAAMDDSQVLSTLNLAFSRAADKSPKTYVQDLLGK